MTKVTIRSSRILGAWLVASVTTTGAVCAQDDAEPGVAPIREQLVREVHMQAETGRVQKSEARRKLRDRFAAFLNARLESLERRYRLSEPQKKKLILAGRADIERFFDRLEELEKSPLLLMDDIGERWKVVEEINTLILLPGEDLFHDRSLFSKVLANTLTKEQAATQRLLERETVVRRHHATLEWVLKTWDHALGLSADQHRRLKDLFEQETRPPRRFGSDDYFGVLCQVSRISEAKLKAILRDPQWAKLNAEFTQVKQMEPTLKIRGYLPEHDVAAVPGSVNTRDRG